MRAFRQRYGASPLHLLGHLAAFAITYYALSELLLSRYAHPVNWVAWFVGGALLHDLVFLPIYVLLDYVSRIGLQDNPLRPVRAVNFVRVPVVMSATMFLVFFPLILAKGERNYVADTGVAPPDFLRRWLLVTALLFAGSALAYALRVQRSGRRARSAAASG